MTGVESSASSGATLDSDSTSLMCETCPHTWESHDAIAARYCSAVAARSLDRSCICSQNKPTPQPKKENK